MGLAEGRGQIFAPMHVHRMHKHTHEGTDMASPHMQASRETQQLYSLSFWAHPLGVVSSYGVLVKMEATW